MKTRIHARVCLAVLMLCAVGARAAEPDARALIDQANESMAARQYAQAEKAYQQAIQQLPESSELAFDRGVALYRQGDYAKAADSFSRALLTKDRSLEAKAKFNLGNCAYATALAKKEDPKAVMQQLKLATIHYRDALEANPKDVDARANIELAQRFLKLLEEQQKKQEQQSDQDKKDDKDKKDEKKPQSQPSSQPSSKPDSSKDDKQDQKDQDKKDSQQQSKSDKKDQKQSKDQKDSQQQADEKEAQEQKADEKKGKLESAQKDEEKKEGKDQQQMQMIPATQRALTKEEAEKLLQLIRDKERQRAMILQQMRQRQAKQAPVDKDW